VDSLAALQHKILDEAALKVKLAVWRFKQENIVFTNGCFDVLHIGHIHTLQSAKAFGTKLIVGLNDDASVKRLKGEERPIFNNEQRALQLAALSMVDVIVLFEEDTPQNLIDLVLPNVLVKGGDYKAEEIVGYDIVTGNGGRVEIVPYLDGISTTEILVKLG